MSESPPVASDPGLSRQRVVAEAIRLGDADGAIAALDPATARRLVSTAARCWAVAAEEGAEPPDARDTTPTDAVALATSIESSQQQEITQMEDLLG